MLAVRKEITENAPLSPSNLDAVEKVPEFYKYQRGYALALRHALDTPFSLVSMGGGGVGWAAVGRGVPSCVGVGRFGAGVIALSLSGGDTEGVRRAGPCWLAPRPASPEE